MMFTDIHPSVLLLLFGALLLFVPARFIASVKLAAALFIFAVVFYLPQDISRTVTFINQLELQVLYVDWSRWVFAVILMAMFFIAQLYGFNQRKRGEVIASFFYGAGAIGCVFAGDWITLLFFWELMAVSSTFLVWYGGSKRSTGAGIRYLIYHFFGGNLLLFGVLLKVYQGNLGIEVLTGSIDLAFWLIFLGFAVNAAIPPLHTWLTDAYPETSISGILFMNIFTTKVAVFMIMQVFPGQGFLIYLGVFMAIYGVLYAILENKIRKLLSYHIVSQVGLMIAAIGIGTELAINGAFALAIGNILFKSLLFMSCGVIIYSTNRWKLTDLGGLYRKMPVNTLMFMIGALAISGLPFLNGYVSKALVGAAASEYHRFVAIAIYVASVGTALSIPLKLGYYGFVYKSDADYQWKYKHERELVANVPYKYITMIALALACIVFGVLPQSLFQLMPYVVDYTPYTMTKVIEELFFLIGIAAVFVLLLPRLTPKAVMNLDFDWFLRVSLKRLLLRLADSIQLLGKVVSKPNKAIGSFVIAKMQTYNPDRNRVMLEWIVVPALLVFVISVMLMIAVIP
ncbi:proton-conducting transporter transmembrane domain-containing protein [Desulfuribacillus alkaliarsenatis]|uniref:NADH:quinone oxidoreductase/Mrp antiporter transmembrane domain-containing protein n=1 Tax=Desulfuribacillus alkaliarsenatis TaxID=766136 RepID=A0A1E5G452_9FIRM|nr:proton-conducting transporter membrane subunit [Desulfuribacillus alkaliarsenatis]OEF97866.1 hypothetical protein BHF68_13645 [Desulfuribacillus alkaliarsenatis]